METLTKWEKSNVFLCVCRYLSFFSYGSAQFDRKKVEKKIFSGPKN